MNDWHTYLNGFVSAWKALADYILKVEGIGKTDVQVCQDALKVLRSDVPERLFREVYDSPFVNQHTFDEAEDFDKTLLRIKLIVLPLSETQKEEIKVLGSQCITLEKLLLIAFFKNQGRLKE